VASGLVVGAPADEQLTVVTPPATPLPAELDGIDDTHRFSC
jgi:hypothetical protein